MWTHICFVIGGIIAFNNHLYDLVLLTILTTPLSLLYHLTYERPGLLAQLEGLCAKSLFIYGFIQIFFAPSIGLLLTEVVLLILTLSVFIYTNIVKESYDPWHCLMHVIPPVWSIFVSLYHKPLIALFL